MTATVHRLTGETLGRGRAAKPPAPTSSGVLLVIQSRSASSGYRTSLRRPRCGV